MSISRDCRYWHWLTKPTSAWYPQRWIVLASVGQRVAGISQPGEILDSLSVCAVMGRHWYHNHWQGGEATIAHTPSAAREAISRRLRGERTTWVIGPELSRTLTLIDWWGECVAGRVASVRIDDDATEPPDDHQEQRQRIGSIVCLNDPPFILACWWGRHRMVLVDLRNYIDQDIGAIASRLNQVTLREIGVNPETTGPDMDVQSHLAATWFVMRPLIDLWREASPGPWGPTLASLAWNSWRHSYMPEKSVLVHGDERALLMERLAYYGGRCRINYAGAVVSKGSADLPIAERMDLPVFEVAGQLALCDYRSLYPWCVSNVPMPARLRRHHNGEGAIVARCVTGDSVGVAHVTLRTDRPDYPCRVDRETLMPMLGPWASAPEGWDGRPHRVIYPVGEFETVLCGAELKMALSRGHVQRVWEWYEYDGATVASRWCANHDQHRQHWQLAGLTNQAAIHKGLMNALCGRFGKRRHQWVADPDWNGIHQWGQHAIRDLDTDELVTRRWLFGCCERSQPAGEDYNSCPAIAAAIAAAARVVVLGTIGQVDPRKWWYSDTDSIHAPLDSVLGIAACRDHWSVPMGSLRLVEETGSAVYLGRRCYRWGKEWRACGVPKDAQLVADCAWRYEVGQRAQSLLASDPGRGYTSREVIRAIRMTDLGGRWTESGWVEPWEVMGRGRR